MGNLHPIHTTRFVDIRTVVNISCTRQVNFEKQYFQSSLSRESVSEHRT